MKSKDVPKPIKASFKCKTIELRDTIKFLNASIPSKVEGYKRRLEVTVKTDEVIFVTAGSKKTLYCEAFGPVKFEMSLLYLKDMADTCISRTSTISIGDWFLTYNGHTIDVETCYFEDFTILRSIALPMNYKVNDILNLPNKYTPEEIRFNKLEDEYNSAMLKLGNDLKIIKQRLKKYGITEIEIDKFINERIFHDPKTANNEQIFY
ncbi:hypothetical protein [Mangrovibacterium lignilyticum]|uniref:hypothetical protein n=1 Tax=Mangrovibacterium lignilyticum TaxID=2668052 RepID=UPI0013D3D42D|nr:hypothetical protein [Mangrovibacterium lignilyticum]